jgi:hypothetical protein
MLSMGGKTDAGSADACIERGPHISSPAQPPCERLLSRPAARGPRTRHHGSCVPSYPDPLVVGDRQASYRSLRHCPIFGEQLILRHLAPT